MSTTRWNQIKNIFNAAMERPASERAAFVDQACAGDLDLKREVASLIQAARPTHVSGPVQTGGAAHALANATTASLAFVPLTETAGTTVGPYKLLQTIGEGGFGTVFLADQTSPVRRRVALKIIKLGMDTRQVVARFEAERQALALMDHPNIAKVFDGGATESGRPYFVMEYVKGDPITLFADAHTLTLRERLELLTQVCLAVQHAHQKGIIHRDIKPSNVLVSMVDGKPLAKVIDFGIAKATGAAGGTLTDKTLFTEHRALIGTPEYMSPEQAEGSPDIDTRTDVYGLGVLMYELLTGTTPFEPSRLRSAAYGEMQRIIREEDPPSPSLRITRDVQRDLKKLASTAAQRKVEPQKLNALMRGELDWIVMKALDKDRARRFATPQDFAADIDRHLRGEAVLAAPASTAYRVRKFVRRNKGAVFATSAVTLSLVAGGTIAGWMWSVADSRLDAFATSIAFMNGQLNGHEPQQADRDRWRSNLRETGFPPEEVLNTVGYLAVNTFRQQANQRADELQRALDNLRVQTDAAEWSAYTANLALAQSAMHALDFPEARRVLGHAPRSRQGWEFQFLDLQAKAVQVCIAGSGERTDAWLDEFGMLTRHPLQSDVSKVQSWDINSGTANGLRRSTPADAEQQTRTAATHVNFFDPMIRMSGITTTADVAGATRSDWRLVSGHGTGVSRTYLVDLRLQQALRWRSSIDAASMASDDHIIGVLLPWGVDSGDLALARLDQLGGPEQYALQRPALFIAAILASSPNGPSGLTLATPDGTRRIVSSGDKTIRFYETKEGKPTLPATVESPEGVYREVASFRMHESVTNLQMTGDGTRLIITQSDGVARVWDIRDPQERRKDMQAEWAERVPAGAYLDTLWASKTPTEQLRDAIIADASLTPLRRLVAVELLEERIEDTRRAAETARDTLTKDATPTTDPATIRTTAAAMDLPPRVKEKVLTLLADWKPPSAMSEEEQRLAAETKQRRLAEGDAAIGVANLVLLDPDGAAIKEVWKERDRVDVSMLRAAVAAREQYYGTTDGRTLQAMLVLARAMDSSGPEWWALSEKMARAVQPKSPVDGTMLQIRAYQAKARWHQCRFEDYSALMGEVAIALPLVADRSSLVDLRVPAFGGSAFLLLNTATPNPGNLERIAKTLLDESNPSYAAWEFARYHAARGERLSDALHALQSSVNLRNGSVHAVAPGNDLPRERCVIAMIRLKLSTADPATLAAAAEIDGKPGSLTGGNVLDREGHRAAAREALAKARALMAPAADGTPSPWSNDADAKALLAEAASLIEGAGPAPARAGGLP